MKKLKIVYTLFLFAITSTIALAQSIAFKAEVNKKSVAVGESLQVGFYIETDEINYTIDKPMQYPTYNGFRLIGEDKTKYTQFVNGKGLTQDGIILVFTAEKEGKLKIGSARITIDGKNYNTKPIEIEVVKQSNLSTTNKINTNQPAFLQANVSNPNPYVNEQVNLTVKMFSRDLGLLNRKKNFRQGKLDGLSPKMVTSKPETIKQEMVSGKQYFSEEVAKYVIFPEKEGQITIDPFSVDILVSGIYGTEAYEIRSNPVVINAKAIPEEGRPKNFTGAVGDFKLKTDLNKSEIKANESANLKVEISGTGNFNKLVVPEVKAPENIETYDPKRYNNYKTYDKGMQGSIASEIIMVPEQEGSYTISPVEFSYFDPKKEKFITLKTDEVKLAVNGKLENDDDDDDREDEEYNTNKEKYSSIISLKNATLLATGGIVLLATLGLFYIKRKKDNNETIEIESEKSTNHKKFQPKQTINSDTTKINQSVKLTTESKTNFDKKLNLLQQNINNTDLKAFYQLQENLLCEIGMQLTATDLANFSDFVVGEKLVNKGYDLALVNEWKLLLNNARQAKYSALNANENDDLTAIYFKTEKLIQQFLK